MKNLILSLVAYYTFCTSVGGQNLVPNSGFETYTSCPTSQDQLYKAFPWVRPTANTSDYYNSCSSAYDAHVPLNWEGFQYAHSGNGYAGFASYYGGNSREYIEAPLLDTLNAGKTYCVSFYVSLSDSSVNGISPIGAYFSSTFYNNQGQIDNLSFNPQINSSLQIPLSDTANWMPISGSFIANGNEKYIIIGTFSPDSLLTIDTIRSVTPSSIKFAYYYIDDISVIEVTDCKAGNDAIICENDSAQLGIEPADSSITYSWQPSSGLSVYNIANPKAAPITTTTYTLTQTQCNIISSSIVTITVNHDCSSAQNIFIPTILSGNEQLKIKGLEANSTLEIFDMRGRLVYKFSDYQNDFSVFALAEGNYIVRLTRPDNNVIKQKLTVVK